MDDTGEGMPADNPQAIPENVAVDLFRFMLTYNSCQEEELLTRFDEFLHKAIVVDTRPNCICAKLVRFKFRNQPENVVKMEQMILARMCNHCSTQPESTITTTCWFYPFHLAAGIGNIELICSLIEHGCDVYATGGMEKVLPFEILVVNRHYTAAQLLISKGFCYKSTLAERAPGTHRSLLLQLATHNDVEGIQLWINAGAVIGKEDWKQLMYVSVIRGNIETLSLLLSLGLGDVNDKIDVDDDYPALYFARNEETAELLLSQGADPSIVVDPKGTALMAQIYARRLSVAEAIVRDKPDWVDLTVTDAVEDASNYYSALHYAAWQGYLEGVKMLCSYGADPTLLTYDGNTAVGLACHADSAECVKYLLSLGVDTNQQDNDGDTALIYAAHNGNSEIVAVLLEHGANPSICNKMDITPLWNAVYSRSLPSVQMLLTLNVDAEKPSQGQNIYEDFIDHIYDVPVSPLFVAIHREDLGIVKLLINAGCYLNYEKYSVPNFDMYVQHWAEENRRWLDYVTSTPPSLAWWCKRTIRTKLLGVNPRSDVGKLHVPSCLKNYILEI